jgi:hypothetical protein
LFFQVFSIYCAFDSSFINRPLVNFTRRRPKVMARRKRSSNPLNIARIRLAGLKSIKEKPELGPRLSIDDYEQRIERFAAKIAQYNEMLAKLDQMLNEVQADERELRTDNLRMLAGVGAHYGPDSSEYEAVGGTRRSERKRPTKKAKPKNTESGNDA